jgi:hypothetical protein
MADRGRFHGFDGCEGIEEAQMVRLKNRFIIIAAVAGLVAFVGDFLVTIVLGFFYPNYNHLKLVMSELGTPQSPVAVWIGLWWVVFGILFITFAIGFAAVFASGKKSALIVALLIALFGLGAGVGAGLFPMDPVGSETTLAGELHDVFAGAGFFAVAFVPLASLAVFPRKRVPGMYWLSIAVFVLGLVFFALFVISEDVPSTEGILSYTGLWQRLFLLIHYTYLGVIAALMIRSAQRSA